MLSYLLFAGLSFALAVICVFVLAIQLKKFMDLRKEYGNMKNKTGPLFDEYLDLRRRAGAYSIMNGLITVFCLVWLSLMLRGGPIEALVNLVTGR